MCSVALCCASCSCASCSCACGCNHSQVCHTLVKQPTSQPTNQHNTLHYWTIKLSSLWLNQSICYLLVCFLFFISVRVFLCVSLSLSLVLICFSCRAQLWSAKLNLIWSAKPNSDLQSSTLIWTSHVFLAPNWTPGPLWETYTGTWTLNHSACIFHWTEASVQLSSLDGYEDSWMSGANFLMSFFFIPLSPAPCSQPYPPWWLCACPFDLPCWNSHHCGQPRSPGWVCPMSKILGLSSATPALPAWLLVSPFHTKITMMCRLSLR